MREYIALFRYNRGVNPVRDVFINHSQLVATSLTISASSNTEWRVERVSGPENALDALETVYLDPDICNECVDPHPACDIQVEYEVLEREPTARTIYRSTNEGGFCYSVSSLAVETLGTGVVFGTMQRGPYYEWRVLIPADRELGAFHDALKRDLPDGVSLTVRRVGSPEQWQYTLRDYGTDVSYEQREALETAVRLGYYEYPHEATLEDVAAELDLPLTTLRYRLRRAETWAIVVAQEPMLADEQTATDTSAVLFDQD